MLANASILITGGTGSFGKAFVGTILKRYPEIKRLVVFSRDELKQFDLTGSFCTKRIDRNCLGKELGHAEKETHPGADCDAAAADRSGDVTGQIGIARVPGGRDLGSPVSRNSSGGRSR